MNTNELKEQIFIMGCTLGTMEDQAVAFQLMDDYEKDRQNMHSKSSMPRMRKKSTS